MSEPSGISMRFTQPMVFDPKSHVFVLCGCGQSFDYFGLLAGEKARAFMETHPCSLKPAQRTGDEPV